MAKKRCLFCRGWFLPYAPQAERALICGKIKEVVPLIVESP